MRMDYFATLFPIGNRGRINRLKDGIFVLEHFLIDLHTLPRSTTFRGGAHCVLIRRWKKKNKFHCEFSKIACITTEFFLKCQP